MTEFDPFEKEQQLQAESAGWDTSQIEPAGPGDIPVIDLDTYFTSGDPAALEIIAAQLRAACEEVGFFSIVGHAVSRQLTGATFDQVRLFHALPLESKTAIQMDRPDWPHGGMGYLPVKNVKLPARDKANFNEAFLIKRDDQISIDDNQWPDAADLPDFRSTVEAYSDAMENLGRRMLPVFARALDMPADFFDQAFINPTYRLRMTHYPPMGADNIDDFGINPHVDTTFCTILAQDRAGLTIYSERRQTWLQVPALDNAFVVNTGELLRQWTNDRFISVKHFANNNVDATSRYSIPFFLNANSEWIMTCVPSCCDDDNPPRYPPVSYASSQAIAQGE